MNKNVTIQQLDPNTFEYQTYSDLDSQLIVQSQLDTVFSASTDYIEYYVYDQNQNLIYPGTTIPLLDYDVRDGDVLLNPQKDLENSGFDLGIYNILYSFYRKRLSSNISEKYFITDISSDRTEIRLDSNTISNELIISSSNSFIQYRETAEYFIDFYLNFGSNQTVIANNIKLETEEGIDPTILIKLYEPLPSNFSIKDELWIVEELSDPQAYELDFPFEPIVEDDFTYISGPNYNLNVIQETSTGGESFSFNTLLQSDVTSSINQIQNLLNQKEIDINVNYENYANFVHFSSAKIRLENFYYKVGLIQSASNQLTEVFYLNSATTATPSYKESKAQLTDKIDNIIKNFDGYESFLYFNSGSQYSYPKTTTTPPFQLALTGSTEALTWIGNATVGDTYYGGQALSASNYDEDNRNRLFYSIPEYLRDDPANEGYELFVDMVAQYYDNVWVYTKDISNKFDADNRLEYGIAKDLVADAIRDFGVKLYASNFNTNDLFTAFLGLTPSGSAFPFPNMTGSLPTESGFEYVDTEISASNDIVPLNNVQKQVYKRIYHNIPYLLKTKGTIAGIRALITSYGIPDTILRISEFGGKDRNESQDYDLKQDVFNYAFNTGPSGTYYISSSFNANSKFPNDGNSIPKNIQFRIKPREIPQPTNNTPSIQIVYSQSLFHAIDNSNVIGPAIVLEYTGSGFVTGSYSGSIANPYDTYGTLKFIPADGDSSNNSASVFLPFFNGDWWSIQASVDMSTATATLFAANQINGKVGFKASSSVSGFDTAYYSDGVKAFLNFNNQIQLQNSVIYEPISGSFQEYRFWNQPISESKFLDYTVNPYSVEGNSLNSTPNELIFRAALGSQLDTGSSTSIHPRVTGSSVQITQSFSLDSSFYTSSATWVVNREDIFQDQVPAGIKNRITDKIQAENLILAEAPYGFQTPTSSNAVIASSTSDVLSSMESIQQQSFVSQSYTPNVNYLEVAFSPSNQINDDINAQLGYFNLGDYIGDPRFISSSDYSYPDLDRLRDAYFEKYIKGYDIVDFIRLIKFFDNSLFKMIKDFTPARTSLASGIVVKQHLLERNRQRPAQVTSSNETLEALVVNLPKDYSSGSSDYPQYSTSGSALYKFSGGPGGVMNRFNGLQSYPSGSDGNGPNNLFLLTQSYDVVGTARDPYAYSIINGTYFNYSSSQFLSASYQGRGIQNVSTQHEFYDGEFSGSGIVITTQSLNPGCSPYLNVVDKGARYNPLFFNGEINNTEQGTVSLNVFNDPNNEPINGFAWIYSQKPINPTLIATTGADPNYNYVYSIKLSRRDIDGNDVTDYLEIGTEIEVDVPSAPTFGGGIPTYIVQGIIPEANSVRLRIALEKGDNRAWNPTIVSNKLEYQRGSVPDGPSSIASFSGSVATVLSPYDLTSLLVPSQSLFSNEFSFFPSASQASGSGEGTIAISYTDNLGLTQFTYNYSGAFEDTNNPAYNGIFRFNVDPTTVMAIPPTAELPLISQNFNISIRTSGQSFFPITSSTAGGSENWSFVASTTYTSSDSRVDENDLRQQNVFKSSISTDQTQFVTVYSDPAKSVLDPPEYNDPLINSVGGTNPWYGPNGLASTNAQPLLLGVNGIGQGETGFFLASGMLNANNQNEYQDFINSGDTRYLSTDIIDDVWRYSSYNLYRTPNVPLNFSMSFYYSASNLGSGGGSTTFTSEGTVHDGQGYNPNNAGNTTQAFTLTGPLALAVRKLFTSTGSGYSSLSQAINAGTNELTTSASSGEIFGAGNFFDAVSLTNLNAVTLKANNQLTINWAGYTPEAASQTFHVLRNSSGFAGVGRVGANIVQPGSFAYDPSNPQFNALYTTAGNAISKIPGDDASESIISGIFIPPTLNESVSTPVFNDNINSLIPGNSGSVVTGSDLTQPAGHPKIALNGTASLNYNFGKFKFAGSPTGQTNVISTPFSASAAAGSLNTDDFQTPSPNTTYWGMNTTTDGAYTINENTEGDWLTLTTATAGQIITSLGGIQPYFTFEIFCYVPVGTTNFNQAKAQVLFTDWDGQTTDLNVVGTINPVLLNNGASFNITNPSSSATQEVQLWSFTATNVYSGGSNGKTYFQGASLGESVEYQLNIETVNDVDFTAYISTWEIDQTRVDYAYIDGFGFGSSFVLFQSGNGTMQSSFGASNDLQVFMNQTNETILSGSIEVEGLLKYTGSINNGVLNGQVVDTVITRTSKGTFDIYNSAVVDLSTLTNAVGTFTNDVEYDSSDVTTTSSTRNLAGGMYYLEYSMSNYNAGSSPTNVFDFEFISDSNQVIGITQSVTQGSPEVDDPSATILPQVIYGNPSNRSTFGEIAQFTSGEVPSVLVSNSESIGHYSFSGSFYPTVGWKLNDSLRMAFRVTKSGANIGVTVISSSFGISPGQSIYSPITSSNPPTAPNPDVFRVPTITQFAIPTFYQDGVLPFGLALDCQPLLNNYNDARRSSYIMDVDYNNESGPIIPVNQAQILAGTAIRAAVPDSNYSSQTWTTPRYKGSRSNCRITNIFSYGDTGTYGQLPNIEIRLAYFAYFESITNPYPLYNNATQLNVAYLIDEQENALPPSLGAQSYEIMNILYPEDSQVSIQVNSGSSVLQEINGTNKIKSVGQRFEPICFSQTSSQGFSDFIPLSGSGRISVYDNVGTAAAKSLFGVSVMGSGVTNVDEVSAIQGSNTFQQVLAPEASIVTASYNNVNPNSVIANDNAPYSGSGIFFFSSSIDKQGDGDLSNPQTIFLDTTFITSFLYESGTDEMRIKLKCVLERDGTESNIDFELDDLTMTAYYLGQSRDCGSILGKDGTRSNWRGGVMVTFVTPNQSTSTLKTNVFEPQRDANNEYNMLFENPVINDLLINRGVNWKRHGGVENGGPVDYLEWKITANTGNFIFKAADKVRFELFGNMTQTGRGRSRLNKFYPQGYITTNQNPSYLPTNFTVIGASDSAEGDNSASAPYWAFTGSGQQEFLEIVDPNFNEAYGTGFQQGFLPYEPGSSEFFEGGFEPTNTRFPTIKQPLKFKINDQIRFVNNENYKYTILEVIPPEENIDVNGQGKVKIKLDKEVPSSIDKNFFLIRRPIDDASITYLDLDYPYDANITNTQLSSSNYSSAGLILPTFPSEFINISSSQIVNNLISKGIIKS